VLEEKKNSEEELRRRTQKKNSEEELRRLDWSIPGCASR
jgi:hypothetical protein